MQSTMTKMVTTVPTTNSETMAVRRIFQGMPMEDQLATLMLLRGATASDFHFLLETDSEFADLFATALYEMVKRTVHKALKSRGGCYFSDADKEDLAQELIVRLLNAASRFEPSRGIPFAGFADKFLRRLSDLIGKIVRKREREVIESEIETEESEDEGERFKLSLFEFWCDPEEIAIANDLMHKLLEQFSPRQWKRKKIAQQLFNGTFDTSSANKVLIHQTRELLRKNLSKLDSLVVNQMSHSSERSNRRCKRR